MFNFVLISLSVFFSTQTFAIDAIDAIDANSAKEESIQTTMPASVGWNQQPDEMEDLYSNFKYLYSNEILPALAEGRACCSTKGVRPNDQDCSLWGITANHRSGSTGRELNSKGVK